MVEFGRLIISVLLCIFCSSCSGFVSRMNNRNGLHIKNRAEGIGRTLETRSRDAKAEQTALHASRGGTGRVRASSGKASIRQARVARALRDEITEIICNIDIKAKVYPNEDLLRSTSISDVEISPDLSYAKIYISVFGNSVEKRQIFVWLCENVGQVRYSLAKRLRHMRRVPELTFKLDNSQGSALAEMLEEIAPSAAEDDEEEFLEFDEDEDEEEEDEEDE